MKMMVYIFLILLFKTNMYSTNNNKIILEENDSNILSRVIDIDVNYKGDKLLITNGNTYQIILYDAKKGKILNILNSGSYLTDSLVNSGKEIYSYNDKKWEYINNNKLKAKYNIELNNKKLNKNYFYNAFFDKNSNIIINSVAYSYVENKKESLLMINGAVGVIMTNQELKLKKITFLESFKGISPNKLLFVFKDTLFVQTINIKSTDENSLFPVISTYNSKGKFINDILYLTEFYTNNNIGYNTFDSKPVIAYNNNVLYYTFPFENDINIYNTNKKIKLTNIETDNIGKLNNLDIFIGSNPSMFKLYSYFPKRIEKIFANNNSLFVFIEIRIENQKPYQLMQMYNIDTGELINSIKINDIIQFQTFTMSKDCKYIYSVHLEDENYVIKKTKVDSLW